MALPRTVIIPARAFDQPRPIRFPLSRRVSDALAWKVHVVFRLVSKMKYNFLISKDDQ
uniref:hypothetical protein n=1 Tax=Burkholderia multivorans TaxID=87883 RepID=UPI0015E2CED6|nr:hypothetical protein [Burkholderia multivorans]